LAKQANPFWLAKNIISLFVLMGCEHNVAEPCIDDSQGSVFGFSYLVNPETKAFVAIVDLGDDEFVSSLLVESWERVLGVQIPKPPDGHGEGGR
jgi:hypothetical protein